MRGILKKMAGAGMGMACLLAFSTACTSTAQGSETGETRFRSIYKELIETDTSLQSGDCTQAASLMRARLVDAGFDGSHYKLIVAPDQPKQGNLVGEWTGTDADLPAVLLLAHIDVVNANRSDWQRDPYKLIEENGYFYARGAIDDKAMAASYIDALIRMRESGFVPARTIKIALTCGEETPSNFNGLKYILKNDPQALTAGFAINEGGRGLLDEEGNKTGFGLQAGEKVYQDITVVATAPGGHSARPVADNAIGRISAALARITAYRFPADMVPASQLFFGRMAEQETGQLAKDLAAVGAGNASDEALDRIATVNPFWNAYMRTTCIPTMISGGHSKNSQPQHVEANINCRILPGENPEMILARVTEVLDDPTLSVTFDDPPEGGSTPPALSDDILGPIDRIANEMFPGVPVIPSLSTGATDGRFLVAAGVPTYGVSGLFGDPDGNGIHGLDERVRVSSLLESREFLFRLIKEYASK